MRLIILDRDGVINEDSDEFIKSPTEWSPIRGSLEAIARLHHAGWRVVVATNQSGIARKLFDLDTLARIHETMHRRVIETGGLIDAVFFCPHGPDDNCSCRKPLPGMFYDIAARLRIDLQGVPAIGDSLRDIQAAQAAGATPLLVKTGKGFGTVSHPDFDPSVPVYNDLYGAVTQLLTN
ncbi:MAG TPA: D-glycero-beta-D-manno-heptose-1,7-bisphosphate 7-phosphatase [Gammaproteobacteria bacterium]|nr:D-glycero-beta-D-manno-heptose-1,7-bisphosphate 7-phosphatase [Gammaproteobacteria bacterium]